MFLHIILYYMFITVILIFAFHENSFSCLYANIFNLFNVKKIQLFITQNKTNELHGLCN